MVNSWVVVRMPPLKRFTFFGEIYVEYPTVFGEIYVKYIWSNNCLGYFLTLPVVTMNTRISSIFLGNLGISKAECSTWQPYWAGGYTQIIPKRLTLPYKSHHAVGTLPDIRPWKTLEKL